MQLKIIKGDITTLKCDAIVNSTNSDLIPSGSIDDAIYKAAGHNLSKRFSEIGFCPKGGCIVTDGYNLPCAYIIHTVAPNYYEPSSSLTLYKCYENAINSALEYNCSSVAIPLIGAGGRGFSAKKALEVAISALDTSMSQIDSDLSICLVLINDELRSAAIALAEKQIDPKYLYNYYPVENPLDNEWVSLCKVNYADKNGDTWMQRIVDYSNGVFITPIFDNNKDKTFDNRPLIFREDGPSSPGSIGFWKWSEVQNKSGKWISKATYQHTLIPIELIYYDSSSTIENIVEILKTGFHLPTYINRYVMLAIKNNSKICAVLCDLNSFDTHLENDMIIKLKKNINVLPYYEFDEYSVYVWNGRNIYNHIPIDEPSKYIPVSNPSETIKQMFLQRMTWPIFKSKGVTKAEWQRIKQFITEIPDDSMLEELSEMYGVSTQDAKIFIDHFLQSSEKYISSEDVDSILIAQLLSGNETLKHICNEIAEQKWKEEHSSEIEFAKSNLDDIKASVTLAEERHNKVLADLSISQNKLDQIVKEIEEYEAIGNDTLSAVKSKISEAQKDISSFLAELSFFLPQTNAIPVSTSSSSAVDYKVNATPSFDDDKIDISENYNDECFSLSQNLSACLTIDSDFSALLSAFLYSAHINDIPLLICGPAGCDISNILSMSLYAKPSGVLTLSTEADYSSINEQPEHVVSVHNMFNTGWSSDLPQTFSKLSKHIIWSNPHTEDMLIEPKSIYNYMLPVFSECFVGSSLICAPVPSKRADSFKMVSLPKVSPLHLDAFKKLGLSKLLLNQLEKLLSDTKFFADNPYKEKDIEVLFGLLPLCVLIGKKDILKEVIESETHISGSVKNEVLRYIEE